MTFCLTMDNCGGQSYDGAGNMAGRYAGVLTLIQHQFPKFILLLDKFLLVETSHTNCWIHPCSHSILPWRKEGKENNEGEKKERKREEITMAEIRFLPSNLGGCCEQSTLRTIFFSRASHRNTRVAGNKATHTDLPTWSSLLMLVPEVWQVSRCDTLCSLCEEASGSLSSADLVQISWSSSPSRIAILPFSWPHHTSHTYSSHGLFRSSESSEESPAACGGVSFPWGFFNSRAVMQWMGIPLPVCTRLGSSSWTGVCPAESE